MVVGFFGRKRHHRLMPVTLSAALLVLSSTVALAGPGPQEPAASPPSSGLQVTAASPLSLIAGKINFEAPTLFPSSYGDMQIDDFTHITVYEVGQDRKLASYLANLTGGAIHVTYVQVKYSAVFLRNLAERVVKDKSALAASGLSIEQLVPDVESGTVDAYLETPAGAASNVATAPDVGSAQVVVDARYGSQMLTVEPTTQDPGALLSNRTNDYAPFWGGDSLTNTNELGQEFCSTGFAVVDADGKDGVLSAGHCGGRGQTEYDNCQPPTSLDYCPVREIGVTTATSSYYTNQNSTGDFMVIDAPVQSDVYGGGVNGSSYYSVVGSETKAACCVTVDGAATGEITGNYVITTWTCFDYICGLGEAENNNNTNLGICRHGDSGGPVYEHISPWSSVMANGIIVAGDRSLDGGVTFTRCYYELASTMAGAQVTIIG